MSFILNFVKKNNYRFFKIVYKEFGRKQQLLQVTVFFLNFDCNNILDFNCKAHLIIYLHVNLRYKNNNYYYYCFRSAVDARRASHEDSLFSLFYAKTIVAW